MSSAPSQLGRLDLFVHVAPASCLCPQAYGYELPKDIEYIYTHVRKTHNTGVFDAYTDEMKRARKSGILTGECAAAVLWVPWVLEATPHASSTTDRP